METLDLLKKAEDYGYITHDEAIALAKKALGVPEAVVVAPAPETPAEQPAA